MTESTANALETAVLIQTKDEVVQNSRSKVLLHRLFLIVCGFLVCVGAQGFFAIARPSVHSIEGHTSPRIRHERISNDDRIKAQGDQDESKLALLDQQDEKNVDTTGDTVVNDTQHDEVEADQGDEVEVDQPEKLENDQTIKTEEVEPSEAEGVESEVSGDEEPDKVEKGDPNEPDKVEKGEPNEAEDDEPSDTEDDESDEAGDDKLSDAKRGKAKDVQLDQKPDAKPTKVDPDADDSPVPPKGKQSTPRIKLQPVLAVDSQLAMDFVAQRKAVYHESGLDYRWKLRGIGYLQHVHQLVLMAFLPPLGPSGGVDIATGSDGKVQADQDKQAVIIRNVNKESATFTDCDKLTLWVRVAGPEIFSDAAVAVKDEDSDTCYWMFEFDLMVPGTYEVDVKVLIWNGAAAIGGTPESQCEFSKGPMDNETLAQHKHDGFQGFKMYKPTQMCCEICARTPQCQAWSTPFLRLEEAWSGRNGCELVFPPDAPDSVLPVSSLWPPRRRSLRRGVEEFHGLVHTNPASYFCGCGWSFWFTLDFPCVSGDLDDRVFLSKSNFTAQLAKSKTTKSSRATSTELKEQQLPLPLCTLEHERVGKPTNGRWVRELWPDSLTCPEPYTMADPKSKSFPMTKFDDMHPSCWHREDLSKIGTRCLEMNCQLVNQTSQWNSHLHQEKEFFGVWRPYHCNYVQFTTAQLQECVSKKKIVKFERRGASVAEFAGEFMDHRLENVTLYEDDSDKDALTVVYDTLSLLHKNGPDDVIHEYLSSLPKAPAHEEHYWISGFFLSSEREVHAHAIRMQKYNRILAQKLKPKKYKSINAFDLTSAFTYDAATQMDGMHMVGPPMKTIVTKILHHLCKDVVDGIPV